MSAPRCLVFVAVLAVVGIAACERKSSVGPLAQPNPPASPASAVPAPSALHGWLGKWSGVEGTYLQLASKSDAKYDVIIKNLDGERTFEGVGGTDHIYFERDGAVEKIRATDGAGTGMKWLAGKSSCLVIRLGEGYCRE